MTIGGITMQWYEMLIGIVAGIGGAGGLVTLYMARARRTSVEIDNFKKLFDEAQQERENIRTMHDTYKKDTDTKITGLETKIDGMYRRQNIHMRAINAAYGCRHTDSHKECPVIRTLTEEEGRE